MSGRIDYVRIRITGEKITRLTEVNNLNRQMEAIVEKHHLQGKYHRDYLQYDRVLSRWYTNYNVWGPAAQIFYDELPEGLFNHILRLDYRQEATNPNLDIELVADVAIHRAKKKNLARSFHDGPIKSKSGGRDTGGPSIAIGGKESERRIALYMRGHESPAVEGQFTGPKLKANIKRAYDMSLVDNVPFKERLKDYLRQETDKLCRERLLHPLSAFTTDIELDVQKPTNELEDRVYEQLSLLWVFLPVERQQDFISENEPLMYATTDPQRLDVPAFDGKYDNNDELPDEPEELFPDDSGDLPHDEREDISDFSVETDDNYDEYTQGDW